MADTHLVQVVIIRDENGSNRVGYAQIQIHIFIYFRIELDTDNTKYVDYISDIDIWENPFYSHM